jgi:hypothetical protein
MSLNETLKGKTIKNAQFQGYNEWIIVEFTDGTRVMIDSYGASDMFSPITCIRVKQIDA